MTCSVTHTIDEESDIWLRLVLLETVSIPKVFVTHAEFHQKILIVTYNCYSSEMKVIVLIEH